MFTGIVEELGSVVSRDGARLRLEAHTVLEGASLGDSTAVNGCCLTIVDFDEAAGWWDADVSDETYTRTSLGSLAAGDPVNLERAVRTDQRIGGHLVRGVIEYTGTLISLTPAEYSVVARFSAPREIMRRRITFTRATSSRGLKGLVT